jgi:peptidoglycan L-alanyl-D-glutamate endopeptidase CwlK
VDKATLERIKTAHPKVRDELGTIYTEIVAALKGRAMCRFAFVLRTFAEQTALYAQGREPLAAVNAKRKAANWGPIDAATNKSKVTNAQAGLSIHNYGAAVDIVLVVDTNRDGKYETASWDTKTDFDGDGISDWMEVVAIFKKYGWEWGGDWKSFKDLPHFEKTFGKKASDLLALRNAKKVDKEGYVLL